MSDSIFISYRRDDASAWAGRLHMALEKHFASDRLFMDVDTIEAGKDFVQTLDTHVSKCSVLLAVIGKNWIDARDATGRRRLDDPGDFVRLEIASALKRNVRVVPVLVDGASLPKAEDLPDDLKALVRRQTWPISHARFGAEVRDLIGEIARDVPTAAAAESEEVKSVKTAKDILLGFSALPAFAAIAYLSSWANTLLGKPDTTFGVVGAAIFVILLILLLMFVRKMTERQWTALWLLTSLLFPAAAFTAGDLLWGWWPVPRNRATLPQHVNWLDDLLAAVSSGAGWYVLFAWVLYFFLMPLVLVVRRGKN